ncbi:MBL fold metallo-hydrolase [Salininema proteolyticum]|uniref:MBL fold metallo-hydrolase n=1 Tax=Salininema proteolyticum TaxID=1607685 RepID=A0ABV8TUU3_9ACTN
MRLERFTHSCVRLSHRESRIAIDPGTWAEPEALDGVTHVLLTHEHRDHCDVAALNRAIEDNPGLEVYTHPDLAERMRDAAVMPVGPGEHVELNGLAVHAVGGSHAETYERLPNCGNIGFLVETPQGLLYHPGDALHVPEGTVDRLLSPPPRS